MQIMIITVQAEEGNVWVSRRVKPRWSQRICEGFLRTVDGLPSHIRLIQFSPLRGLMGYNLCLLSASSQLLV